jgi:hypothetical protein
MNIEAMKILMVAGGLLICFFSGYWFNRINKNQDEVGSELKVLAVDSMEHEMTCKRIDSDTRDLRKQNEKLDVELKKQALQLSKDMGNMTRSIEKMSKTTMIHDIEIKNTKIDIMNLKNENRSISEWIRGFDRGDKAS